MMLLNHFQYFVQLLQPNPFLNLPSLPLHDVVTDVIHGSFRISVVNTDVVPEAKLEEAVTPNAEAPYGEDLTVKMRGNEGWKMRRYVYLLFLVCCGCEFTDVF